MGGGGGSGERREGRAGGEWEAAAERQAAPGRERTGWELTEHGTAQVLREGQGEEKRSRFQKSGALLAILDTLRATGDRGSAFAMGP